MKKIFIFVLLVFSCSIAYAGSPNLSASESNGTITLKPNQPESPYFLNDIWRKPPGGSWSRLQVTYGAYSVKDSPGGSGTYQYRTRWFNPSGPSNSQYTWWSSTVYVYISIDEPPSPRPTISLPSTDSDGNFNVSWSSSSQAVNYILQRKINSGSWLNQQNSSSRSKAYSNQGGGSYSFRVKACNSFGCTSYSAVKTVVVTSSSGPARPSSITYLPSPTNVVYWSAVSGATSYVMQYRSGSSWVTYYNGTGTGTTVGGTGATQFRVKACNSNGCSSWRSS